MISSALNLKLQDTNPVVIFSAVGYPSDFVLYRSLQKWREDCSIYVITSRKYATHWGEHVDGVLLTKSNSKGFWINLIQKVIRRSNVLARIIRNILKTKIMYRISFILMPPHNARHFYYREAIANLRADSKVFLVDSRDLIFQESPLVISERIGNSKGVQLFDEGEVSFKDGKVQLNGTSPANLNWALELLNNRAEKIGNLLDKAIINSGCIFGTASDLFDFLKYSEDTILNSDYANISLLDQASVNFVAYCTDFPVKVIKNGEIVLNMCGIINTKVTEKKGKLFNDGRLIPIVHQFDRFGVWDSEKEFTFGKRQYKVQNDS